MAGILRDGCSRIVAGFFGFVLLVSVLFVPCVKTTFIERPDASGRLLYKISVPRKAYVFLPHYLKLKARGGTEAGSIRIKTLQWAATVGFVVLMGIADTLLLCSRLRKRRTPPEEPGGDGDGASGFSLLR